MTLQMMVRLITAIPRSIAGRLLNRKPEIIEAWAYVYVQGFLRGYSLGVCDWLNKQAALESGFGESFSIQTDKNPFGMSAVSTRQTTQTGSRETESGIVRGVYASVWDAVKDRFMWDEYFGTEAHKRDLDKYANAVGDVYYPGGNYSSAVGATSVDDARMTGLFVWAMVPVELIAIKNIW